MLHAEGTRWLERWAELRQAATAAQHSRLDCNGRAWAGGEGERACCYGPGRTSLEGTGVRRLAVAGCGVLRGQRLYAVRSRTWSSRRGTDAQIGAHERVFTGQKGKDGFEVSVALMSAPLQHAWNWALSLVALVTKAANLLTPIIVG